MCILPLLCCVVEDEGKTRSTDPWANTHIKTMSRVLWNIYGFAHQLKRRTTWNPNIGLFRAMYYLASITGETLTAQWRYAAVKKKKNIALLILLYKKGWVGQSNSYLHKARPINKKEGIRRGYRIKILASTSAKVICTVIIEANGVIQVTVKSIE